MTTILLTPVYVKVRHSATNTYYTVPQNLQNQYLEACAKVSRISNKILNASKLSLFLGSAFVLTGFGLSLTNKNLIASLAFLGVGIFTIIASAAVLRRNHRIKKELLQCRKKIAQKVAAVHLNRQEEEEIETLNSLRIPPNSKIIPFTVENRLLSYGAISPRENSMSGFSLEDTDK